jgi:glycosyltransferase involved in cell wall biosynthesis
MNLLLIDQFSDPGGAQLCLRDLLPGFLERGWKPRLMVPGEGPLAQAAAAYGIPVHPLPIGRYANGGKTVCDALRFVIDMPRAAAAVHAIVRRHAIDLVYANGPRLLPAIAGTGRPTVFHSHSVLDKPYARRLAEWALRRAGAGVLAASRYVADSWTDVGPIQVVYTGVSDQRPAACARRHAAPVRIGIVGRIAPEKGHTDLLEAAKLIRAAGRDVRFLVYGAALFSDAAYERHVRRLREGLPVEFRGWVDHVASAWGELDIVAMPSRSNEAAPRVAIEAMSAGIPVVAYRSGGIPELVEHGRAGILTGALTPEALAGAILPLIDRPELRARLGAGGRRSWETRFTLERYRREVCELVEWAARAPSTSGRGCR